MLVHSIIVSCRAMTSIYLVVVLFCVKASSILRKKYICLIGSVPAAFGFILLSCLYLFSYIASYAPS